MSAATRILVVVGTPLGDSLDHGLARSYVEAAQAAGAQVRVHDLAADPIPEHPSLRDQLRTPRADRPEDLPLDPAAAAYIDDVDWADHLVFFFPQWWGTYPAAFKAWIDRVLLSGFAFAYRPAGSAWDRLLTGRTARIVMTMDSPGWWSRVLYRDAGVRALRTATLWYCGVRTVGVTRIGSVRHTESAGLERRVGAMARLGTADARRTSGATRRSRTEVGAQA
ncbi:NAD(P)H-dependent oxidoreductase [Demequina sp.]|uniref:NAD(P)H-dependent oxidoreductase n=1 Tax=Demequina sp. TaxID=2050685 RepID=UPI003A8A6EAC